MSWRHGERQGLRQRPARPQLSGSGGGLRMPGNRISSEVQVGGVHLHIAHVVGPARAGEYRDLLLVDLNIARRGTIADTAVLLGLSIALTRGARDPGLPLGLAVRVVVLNLPRFRILIVHAFRQPLSRRMRRRLTVRARRRRMPDSRCPVPVPRLNERGNTRASDSLNARPSGARTHARVHRTDFRTHPGGATTPPQPPVNGGWSEPDGGLLTELLLPCRDGADR